MQYQFLKVDFEFLGEKRIPLKSGCEMSREEKYMNTNLTGTIMMAINGNKFLGDLRQPT